MLHLWAFAGINHLVSLEITFSSLLAYLATRVSVEGSALFFANVIIQQMCGEQLSDVH